MRSPPSDVLSSECGAWPVWRSERGAWPVWRSRLQGTLARGALGLPTASRSRGRSADGEAEPQHPGPASAGRGIGVLWRLGSVFIWRHRRLVFAEPRGRAPAVRTSRHERALAAPAPGPCARLPLRGGGTAVTPTLAVRAGRLRGERLRPSARGHTHTCVRTPALAHRSGYKSRKGLREAGDEDSARSDSRAPSALKPV